MFCKYCGKENKEGNVFCQYCGKRMVENAYKEEPEDIRQEEFRTFDAEIKEGDINEEASAMRKKSCYDNNIFIPVFIILAILLIVFVYKCTDKSGQSDKGEDNVFEEAAPAVGKEDPVVEEAAPAKEEAPVKKTPENDSGKNWADDIPVEIDSDYEVAPAASEFFSDSADIHEYKIIVNDVGWDAAYKDCKDRGGYLVRINSQEEYDYLKKMIDKEGKEKYVFMLGGGYNSEDGHYRWYYDGSFEESRLDTDYPYREFWMKGEPSYEGKDADGNILEEHYLDMFYSKKEKDYVWNDVPEDLTSYYPGKVAYICEYE